MQESGQESNYELTARDGVPVVCPEVNITVAYNVYIWPPQDWKFLVGSQLQDLASSGLHHCAQMVIAISVPEQHDNHTYLELQELMHEAVSFVRAQEAGRDAVVIQEHENTFEYPAIHSLYRVASREHSSVAHNHLFMYFHTKGMANHGVRKQRMEIERAVFAATVVPWRGITQQFIANDDIRAAAWMPSKLGFGWYNFWWARGDFLQKLREPKRGVPRHKYESWLGRVDRGVVNGTKVLSTCTCGFLGVDSSEIYYARKSCVEITPDTCMP